MGPIAMVLSCLNTDSALTSVISFHQTHFKGCQETLKETHFKVAVPFFCRIGSEWQGPAAKSRMKLEGSHRLTGDGSLFAL